MKYNSFWANKTEKSLRQKGEIQDQILYNIKR